MLDGASELESAFTVSRRATERLGLIAFGLVSVVAALAVFSSPGGSLVLLARIGGVILLLFGVVTLVSVFLGRGQRSADPACSASAHQRPFRTPTPFGGRTDASDQAPFAAAGS